MLNIDKRFRRGLTLMETTLVIAVGMGFLAGGIVFAKKANDDAMIANLSLSLTRVAAAADHEIVDGINGVNQIPVVFPEGLPDIRVREQTASHPWAPLGVSIYRETDRSVRFVMRGVDAGRCLGVMAKVEPAFIPVGMDGYRIVGNNITEWGNGFPPCPSSGIVDIGWAFSSHPIGQTAEAPPPDYDPVDPGGPPNIFDEPPPPPSDPTPSPEPPPPPPPAPAPEPEPEPEPEPIPRDYAGLQHRAINAPDFEFNRSFIDPEYLQGNVWLDIIYSRDLSEANRAKVFLPGQTFAIWGDGDPGIVIGDEDPISEGTLPAGSSRVRLASPGCGETSTVYIAIGEPGHEKVGKVVLERNHGGQQCNGRGPGHNSGN